MNRLKANRVADGTVSRADEPGEPGGDPGGTGVSAPEQPLVGAPEEPTIRPPARPPPNRPRSAGLVGFFAPSIFGK